MRRKVGVGVRWGGRGRGGRVGIVRREGEGDGRGGGGVVEFIFLRLRRERVRGFRPNLGGWGRVWRSIEIVTLFRSNGWWEERRWRE